ncbi:unnamed protein product [Cylicostephanus goldi]|uniref:Uncharacterized protein n=1 Tax=Cylicostephanus goldi TaxID=71465 RepID=A0A3P7P012_CYLGO|nr:unnamed protein product [Cylicostephanus goldi]
MSFERSRQNCSEIDLDEIYPIRKEAEQPRGSLQEYGNPKPFQDNFVQKETRSSSVPVESNLDWVASLVGSENGSKENDIGLAYSKPIVTQESMTTAEPLPNLVYSKPIVTQESVTTVEPLPNLAYSKPTVTQRSMATAEPLPNGHKDAGADDWLRSLVTSEHPAPAAKELVDQKITKELPKDVEQPNVQSIPAPEPINDLIHKVFDREDDPNAKNSKKCSCAACETDATASTPVPAERKRRLAQKEEVSI